MRKFTKEFITSFISVILAILAIGLFISSGGTILFYVAVAIALAFGFYNVWLISLTDSETVRPVSRKGAGRRKR